MTDAVSAASAATTTQASAAKATRPTGLTSDFETFLKMLTAQARYQDPLEPLDSTEYASQLAQFSMVEQQVQGNDLLLAMQNQLGLSNMAAMSGWVGMEARVAAPGYFDGSSPVVVAPNPAAAADQVTMVVTDAEGTEVARINLPVSAEPYSWDGTDQEGNTLEPGSYAFTIESSRDGDVLLTDLAEVYTKVTETQMQGGDVVLITEGGSAILASTVTGLRDAPAET
ncbi:flagellar hook capping FlgD N-terminal domain-containing protein [Phaeobacter gallaeciensis]|uniref:flagellar hook capping FlgD N-terminal domain-containing protein n=1 Tax=Phaeobacter gallaeciensis TaxID=60890 RepID=UPI00237EEEC8|nr:flagellar hook capping FlgD N-terminal domain-containing protein [Phaeobacter gallaeciensis]MDE4304632.1 flagellar hook capping FlgD N-terminal domain-containing protein [Phaeobacter gallaeciensis]MDE4308634.1 flagellar hook capping FlgD N-terminal domain-containing protein [Phaeobacter gallaeciensis]MDE4313091.1 flagellar hook capping FlgD N-terminal domain-containing protein [Phaeobacter gallaeciensis]MDE4317622.1 flagellar hook capping FlgD N-terminal domain-containing protein [Phaeobacte